MLSTRQKSEKRKRERLQNERLRATPKRRFNMGSSEDKPVAPSLPGFSQPEGGHIHMCYKCNVDNRKYFTKIYGPHVFFRGELAWVKVVRYGYSRDVCVDHMEKLAAIKDMWLGHFTGCRLVVVPVAMLPSKGLSWTVEELDDYNNLPWLRLEDLTACIANCLITPDEYNPEPFQSAADKFAFLYATEDVLGVSRNKRHFI